MNEKDEKKEQMAKARLVQGLAELLLEQVKDSQRYGEINEWGCAYNGREDGAAREQIKDTCKQLRLVLSKLAHLY